MSNREEILSSVKKTVKKIDPGAHTILFGSRSRGDYTEESDWDFLILTNHETTDTLKRKIRDRIFYVELELNVAITTIIYSKKEWKRLQVTPLYKSVASEGISV